jgi:excisionase family DNA binding protein
MKAEIDDTELIDRIVKKVVEQITPLLRQNSQGNNNELITFHELANYLRVKKSSIYDKVYTKSIPFPKHGNPLRFGRKHIDLWLQNSYHPELNIRKLRGFNSLTSINNFGNMQINQQLSIDSNIIKLTGSVISDKIKNVVEDNEANS